MDWSNYWRMLYYHNTDTTTLESLMAFVEEIRSILIWS